MIYYDAEIEYLESTGTLYINTGFKPNQDTRIFTTMKCVTSNTYGRLFGAGMYNTANSIMIDYESGATGILYVKYGPKTAWTKVSSVKGDYNIHTYDYNKNEVYRDEVKVSENTYTAFQCTANLGIFTYINTSNNPGSSTEFFKGRCYKFQIYDNDILINDLIPVRIGTTGYLYDKISDRLFGNAGTGSFVLGPDIAGLPRMEGTPKVSILRRKLLLFMPKYKPNYLCFTAIDKGTFTLSIPAALTTSKLSYVEYSINDCSTWIHTDNINSTNVTITTPKIIPGKKVYWRGIGIACAQNASTYCKFSSTGRFNLSGHINSILASNNYETSTVNSNTYVFEGLFLGCATLINAKDCVFSNSRPGYQGYQQMFYGCTSLMSAPELPATTLDVACYDKMFYNCKELIKAPELPALTLPQWSYQQMFLGCSKLNYIKMLATDVSTSQCLNNWVSGVLTTSGTFIRNSEATWVKIGVSGIPTNWTWFDGTESENDETITFVDPEVQRIMVAQWGGKMGGVAAGSTRKCGIGTSTTTGIKRGGYSDGVIYKKQVETIVTINSQFYQNKVIVDFSDLNKLTSLTTIQSSSSGNNYNRGFNQCTNLKYITFPNSLKTLGSGYTYGRGMFRGTALEEVYIPDNVTSMGENTFGECSKLVSVRWSSNVPIPVYTNGNWAAGTFQNCSNLETLINAPLTITTIRSYEFQRCSKLDFSFLDFTKLTFIGSYGFAYNTGIPTNLMLLSCAQVDNYFLRDAGTHAVYMPAITANLAYHHFGYAKLSILDLGENSTGYIGWTGLTGSPKIVLRANSVYKTDGTTARYTMYNTGAIGKIYVYSDILDDFKALYTDVASKTYAIGGAEWVADFGSSDEWADYPDGVNPLTKE